jgi:hypothetical protein
MDMGKRPDQYQIDPGEGGATDYKNLPQTGRGHSNLDDTVSGDKQRLAQGDKEAKGGQPFLPDVPAPSADTRRGTKEEPAEEEKG